MTPETNSARGLQIATLDIATRPFSIRAKVEVTPRGLLAIGALVGIILLASAAIVQAAKK